MNKKIRFSLLTLLVMLCGTAFADTYTYEFTANTFTAAGTKALGDANWTLSTDAGYWGYDGTKGQQIGSGSNPGKTIVLATSDIAGTISEIKVTTSGANSIAGTLDVTVGGTAFGSQYTLTSTSTEATFTGSASGEIKLNYAQTSSKAIYIKKIEVTYAKAAPEPTGYSVDFNTAIATSSHDFAVASKWKHIVEDNDGSYVGYKWDAAFGTGEPATGGLLVYSQKVGSSSWDMANVYDLLVTPKVSGTIKLKVKAYENASSSTKAFVELYSLNGAATEKAELLKSFQTEIPGYQTGGYNNDWVELSYNVTESQRIGIRAQYVYIDDFYADAIDTTPEAALIVSSVMNSDGQTGTQGTNPQFEQQADGNMKVVLKVTLSNTGDVDFVAGTTENYTLTVGQASYTSGTKTYYEDASIAIPENIAVGETKTFDVEFTIPYISGYKYWYVKENVTGTTSTSYRYATSVAYESKFIFRVAESTSTSDLTTAQAYGRISAAETRSFEIYNDGTAPLVIKSITLPEGFTSDNLPVIPEGGLELAKKTATAAFNITLPVTTIGDFAGNLVIKYVKAGDTDETTKSLAFSGTVLAEGTWFADFTGDAGSSTSGVYPAGSVVTSSTSLQFGSTGSYGSYDHYLKSYSSAGTLVMPKLTATAGAQLKFDAVKYQSGSSYTLKAYVSTDRKTWGEAKATINNSDLETSGQRYTQTLTFDEAGDYYVAFELKGVGLDNVIGLTKTAVAHDIYIKDTTLVTEAQTGKVIKPSVRIVPLTNETAESYTVKYYVDGIAVATAESVELTSSATLDKTFTISYTPNDEVTTEHDTYIAFEFTDGTTIATDHKTLKVTNEPKFLFVAASTSVSQNTTNLTTAQAFGKTNDATISKSFKIYNQGTAPLNVTSIVAPEGFSVNKTEAFTVAAGESEDIIVTFSAATPGEYAGNLVVNYTQGGAQAFELAFSGTMLDSNKWYANFDNPTSSSVIWPAGFVYESGISTSYSGWGPYNCFVYTSGSTETNNRIISPLLHANAGDKFCFDVKNYGSSSHKVSVYLSADRKNWGEAIYTNESINNSDFATIEATIPEAGNYYVGIALTGVYVDELYGLTPAIVAHDWTIASSNVPAEAMQNVASTATVNVLNLGLADEAADSYTATLFVNNEAVATADAVTIPMSNKLGDAGTQLSFNFRYPKVGTFPVYIEVKVGDYSVKTAPVDVVFAAEVAMAGKQIGTKSTTSTNAPFYTQWMDDGDGKSMTDLIYTAEQLAACGINAGDKIISISFVGTPSGTKTITSLTTDVWVAQQDIADFTAGTPNKENMTHVTLHNAETVAFTNGTPYEFKVNLSENPIVYDGTSGIRIYTNINGNGQYQSINFDVDNNYKNAYYAHGTGSFTSSVGNPVAFFGLEASVSTISGIVKNAEGAAVEGATVTLISNDGDGVEYTGTTDAEGAYSINVIQTGRQYNVEVDAEGYESASAIAVSFAEGSVTKDFVIDIPLVAKYIDNPFFTGTPVANGITTYAKDAAEGQVSQMQAVNGWQFGVENGDAKASGAFAIGGSAFLGGTGYLAPAVGAYDETKGNVLGLVAVWSGTVQYTNKTVTLQPGSYTLTVPVYNAKGGTTVPAKSLIGFIADNGTEYLAPAKSYAVDKWTYETVSFNLSEETTGKFSLGYTMTNVGSGSAPHLFIGALSLEVKTLLDGALDELTAELTYAYSLMTEDRTAGLEAFNAAILTAEGLLESTDVAAIKAGIEALQAAENAFLTANLPIAEATYYIYNVAAQGYIVGANNWGTRASISMNGGIEFESVLTSLPDGQYELKSAPLYAGKHLGFDGYVDNGNAANWTIAPVEGQEGVFTLATNDGKVLFWDGGEATTTSVGAMPETTANAYWMFITPEQRLATFANASAENPVDATFLINNPDFGRATSKAAWQGDDFSIGGGDHVNNNAEKWGGNSQTFDIHQTVNVPDGKYKLTWNGFYRYNNTNDNTNDVAASAHAAGTEVINSFVYANDTIVPLTSIADETAVATYGKMPFSQADAAEAFGKGAYEQSVDVVVRGGNLTIGVKKTQHLGCDWTIWDNFRLTYYGEEPVLAGDANLNGEVTTSDAVAAVSFALEKETPSAKAFKAADVDNSGNITVADAVAIVNIALEIPEPEATARGEMSEAVNFLTMNGNALELMNTTEFVGFQMDVTLTNGAMLNGVSLAERAAGLQVAYNRIADNTYRIIAFSTSNTAIEGNEGELFSLDIAGNHNINITNIEFADAAARAYALGFGETTGIKGIYAGATNVESYTVGGVKNDKVRKGMNIVRTADGKVKKVFVK